MRKYVQLASIINVIIKINTELIFKLTVILGEFKVIPKTPHAGIKVKRNDVATNVVLSESATIRLIP